MGSRTVVRWFETAQVRLLTTAERKSLLTSWSQQGSITAYLDAIEVTVIDGRN
jgi:hypothetical protein